MPHTKFGSNRPGTFGEDIFCEMLTDERRDPLHEVISSERQAKKTIPDIFGGYAWMFQISPLEIDFC